ncbi:hypothetical protein AHAS_Ahas19G0277300 [Arachis hypogaea]
MLIHIQAARVLKLRNLVLPERYTHLVTNALGEIGFYHISQIGRVKCKKNLMTALIDRWRLETHIFHLLVGKYTITLEDLAHIYSLPTDGHIVSGRTDNNFAHLVDECVGSACLAYLYKSLCRASHSDTKKMDSSLVLLHVWAWERMPWLSLITAPFLQVASFHWHTGKFCFSHGKWHLLHRELYVMILNVYCYVSE